MKYAWILLFSLIITLTALGKVAKEAPLKPWDPKGPLCVRNMDMFSLMFLTFTPEFPKVLPAGQKFFAAKFDIVNEAKLTGNVTYDYEIERLLLSYRQGLKDGSEISFALPIMSRQNGFLDTIIDWWHATIFGTQPIPRSRELLPIDGLKIHVVKDGKVLVDAERGDGPGDLAIMYKRQLWQKKHNAGAFRFGIELPTGNPDDFLGSGNVDVGAQVDTYWRLTKKLHLYLNLGLVYQGEPSVLPNAREWQDHELVALEWQLTGKDSLIFQVDNQSPTWHTGDPRFDRAYREISIGWRRQLRKDLLLQISFSENSDFAAGEFADFAPDFVVGASMEWYF
jgi:hypothetical protein